MEIYGRKIQGLIEVMKRREKTQPRGEIVGMVDKCTYASVRHVNTWIHDTRMQALFPLCTTSIQDASRAAAHARLDNFA